MKKNTLQKMMLAATLLTLVSCTQDELMKQSTALPDGVYPITFTAVQALPEGMPQTRVSDYEDDGTHKSNWTNGDNIKVTVTGTDSNVQTTTCTLDANGNITTYDPQLYWQTTGDYTIDAWYSNIKGQSTETDKNKTVSLADQTDDLAYVLKAETKIANYKTLSDDMQLEFKHQLAKVRVEIEKKTYTGSLSDLSVTMQGCYTSCTVTNGTISSVQGNGEIKMHSVGENVFEANVVPDTQLKEETFQINADGKTTKANLRSGITLTKGAVHTITLELYKKEPTYIDLTDYKQDSYTVSSGEDAIIDGKDSESSTYIVIEGGNSIVTLKNVQLERHDMNGATPNIKVEGNATIMISGTNEINGEKNACAIEVTGGTLTIMEAESGAKLELIVGNTSGNGSKAALGLTNNASLVIQSGNIIANNQKGGGAGIGSFSDGSSCGDIKIEGGTIEAIGGDDSAGIGSGNQKGCGNITITGGNIRAIGGGGWTGAGIGSSSAGFCGNIDISGNTTVVYAQAGVNDRGTTSSDDIGIGDGGHCGTVTITDEAKENVTTANGKIYGHTGVLFRPSGTCNPAKINIRIFNPIKIDKKTRFPESATRGAQVADSTSSSRRLGKVRSKTEYEP